MHLLLLLSLSSFGASELFVDKFINLCYNPNIERCIVTSAVSGIDLRDIRKVLRSYISLIHVSTDRSRYVYKNTKGTIVIQERDRIISIIKYKGDNNETANGTDLSIL